MDHCALLKQVVVLHKLNSVHAEQSCTLLFAEGLNFYAGIYVILVQFCIPYKIVSLIQINAYSFLFHTVEQK